MKKFQKFGFLLFVFSIIGGFGKVFSQTLKIGFIIEKIQSSIVQDIEIVQKELEGDNHGQLIKDNILILDRDDLNSSRQEFCSMLQEGIGIILDFTYTPWEDGLELIELAGIPRLQIEKLISPFMKVLSAFLSEKSGNDVALIFQNDRDSEEAIFQIVQGFDHRVIILNGMNKNFPRKLIKLRPLPSYYAIFANSKNMKTLIEKIQKFPSDFRADRWNFIYTDLKETLEESNNQWANGSARILINPEMPCKLLMKKSDDCGNSFSIEVLVLKEILKVIQRADQTKPILEKSLNCQDSDLEAPIVNDKVNYDFGEAFRGNEILRYDSGVVSYNLNMDIHLLGSELELLAKWESNQLKKTSESIKPAKRFFRIGTTESIPWSIMRRDPNTQETILDEFGNPTWEGYCIEFIERLSEKLFFDYVIVPPKKGTFGERQSDGSWDGLVGDLVTGDTDIVIAALKMISEREEVIDFVAPYYEQTGISIVIRKAVRQTSLFKFMTVLRLEVWLSIVAALIATAVMIWLLDKYSPYSARNNSNAYPYPCREFSLKESFWFALTSFTPQGGGEAPKAISGRVLVAAYWLFVVLMLATFTANLAAFLTVERMQTPVQSLEQLARQSRINYTVVEGSDTHQFFINMKFAEDTLYRMWKELALNATSDQAQYRIWDYPIKEQYGHILLAINSSNPVKDADEGFRKVNEHEDADYAFIHDSAEIKYAISKNCNLTEVGEVFAEQPYAIAVQQGSHLQDEISYAILELQKDRYFEGLTAKFWNSSNGKDCSGSEESEGITLESLGGVFIATIFGLLLAMITLAGEVIYYRHKHKKEQKVETKIVKEAFGSAPPPSFDVATFRGKKIPDKITLGDEFIPTAQARARISYLPVYPRNPIRQNDEQPPYYE